MSSNNFSQESQQEENKSLLQKAAEVVRSIPVALGLVAKSDEKPEVGDSKFENSGSFREGETQKSKQEEWIGGDHVQTDLQDDVISSLERPHEQKPTQLGAVDLSGTSYLRDLKDSE